MEHFGPKALDALIQVLEPLIDMMPGTLRQAVEDKIKEIPDYDWMQTEVEEIMATILELKGMDKDAFKEAVKEGRIAEILADLFDKCEQLVKDIATTRDMIMQ